MAKFWKIRPSPRIFVDIDIPGAAPFRTLGPVHRYAMGGEPPSRPRLAAAPEFGANTRSILQEIGYRAAEITSLELTGAVHCADPEAPARHRDDIPLPSAPQAPEQEIVS